MIVGAGALYGATMGLWSQRPLQVLFSAIKVPLLLGTSSLLCLPSFFAFNTAFGLRDDFGAACRGLVSAQATFAVVLVALAPLTAFVYASGCSYPSATLTNGAAFLFALLAAQFTLARHYRPLIAKDKRHRLTLSAWLALQMFVSIQVGWTLRPFIGWPAVDTTFFREGAITNAYVDAVQAMLTALRTQ